MKKKLCRLFLAVCCTLIFSGCDVKQTDNKDKNPHAEESTTADKAVSREEIAKMFSGNDLLEIYNDNKPLPVSSIPIIASVSPEDILKGNPILYTRFKTDGRIFELLISDYSNNEFFYTEDAVLIISTEDKWFGELSEPQIIHIEIDTESKCLHPLLNSKNRFKYVDVNFDNLPDLLICTGNHADQGFLTYYCFLQSKNGFYEAPTFTYILNPSIDKKNKMILGKWRNSIASHSWAKYTYQDGVYKKFSKLTEDGIFDNSGNVKRWRWTVDGKEIGRSDRLTEKEQNDLIYNKNSDWNLSNKKWKGWHWYE